MCLYRHLVVETPNANLAAGMRWLLSAYTIRLNHRHQLFGHVFSGRYKALMVDESGNGYLKSACDYVHLNPARAKLLGKGDRLLAYPWSSLMWYLAARPHRPAWIHVDRPLGEHGIQEDSPDGRAEFERHMEARRLEETDEASLYVFRRGWCLGGEEFKRQMLELPEGSLGGNHSGELRRESAENKAERIIAEEMGRLKWSAEDLLSRPKGDLGKLVIAARVRRETTLPIKWIAARLGLGTCKSANGLLHQWTRTNGNSAIPQLQPQPMV